MNLEVRYLKVRSFRDKSARPKLDSVYQLETGGVIYMQRCLDCPKVYVGESGRRTKERKKEHETDMMRTMRMRSAISVSTYA